MLSAQNVWERFASWLPTLIARNTRRQPPTNTTGQFHGPLGRPELARPGSLEPCRSQTARGRTCWLRVGKKRRSGPRSCSGVGSRIRGARSPVKMPLPRKALLTSSRWFSRASVHRCLGGPGWLASNYPGAFVDNVGGISSRGALPYDPYASLPPPLLRKRHRFPHGIGSVTLVVPGVCCPRGEPENRPRSAASECGP